MPRGRPVVSHAHMFIDEVQDASPFGTQECSSGPTPNGGPAERERHAPPETSGSANICWGEDRGEFDWQKTLAALGLDSESGDGHARIEALRVSYRSTAEITTFARGVLGMLAHEAEPIATRHGPPARALYFLIRSRESVAWLADVLKELAADDPEANVALVSRFAAHADAYYEGLVRAEVPRLQKRWPPKTSPGRPASTSPT